MSIISDINLSCLYDPSTAGDDDNCSILTSPTISVSGTLSNPFLQNLSGNASTDNSSRINTDSPTFDFFGKIQQIGDGTISLPNILQHNGITYLKDNEDNQKMNTFFNKVRQWENNKFNTFNTGPETIPLRDLNTTIYTASQGNAKVAINYIKNIECTKCQYPCGIDNPPDCDIEFTCPPYCQASLIMTDYSGTFTNNY